MEERHSLRLPPSCQYAIAFVRNQWMVVLDLLSVLVVVVGIDCDGELLDCFLSRSIICFFRV